MRMIIPVIFLSFFVMNGKALADGEGPVCHKCELIREYNAEHPENNYYWYDDYLKEKKEGTKPATQQQNTNTPAAPKK